MEAKIIGERSAERAMEAVYRERMGRIIGCATKREVADVIRTLEGILTTQDTSPILGDYRSMGDRDPMWLERARSDYFDRILGELGELVYGLIPGHQILLALAAMSLISLLAL